MAEFEPPAQRCRLTEPTDARQIKIVMVGCNQFFLPNYSLEIIRKLGKHHMIDGGSFAEEEFVCTSQNNKGWPTASRLFYYQTPRAHSFGDHLNTQARKQCFFPQHAIAHRYRELNVDVGKVNRIAEFISAPVGNSMVARIL